MGSKTSLITIAALFATANGAVTYDYKKNGADWGTTSADCKLKNQSPIDLKTTAGAYSVYASTEDAPTFDYTDQTTDIEIKWTGDTSKVSIIKTGQSTQKFTSKLAGLIYKADTTFNGQQFHFHAGSEHTIDGKRQDLEMHTVHTAATTLEKFGYAAVGIFFSVASYDKTIDKDTVLVKKIDDFFDSMSWDKNDPKVAKVPYGDLMEAMNWNERWMYKGSVTTPPCTQSVYWNVFKRVLPIKQKHLDLFKNTQLARGANDLKTTGNWRTVQTVDDHNVVVVSATTAATKVAGSSMVKIAGAAATAAAALYLY